MSRHVAGVTLDNLEHLPKKCRSCVFWELAPHLRVDAEKYGQTDFEKEAWVSSVLLDWGKMGDNPSGSPISFRMPLTHEELGNMAGLSRETVTRTLTKFRNDGLVEQHGERMVLLNPAAMELRYS